MLAEDVRKLEQENERLVEENKELRVLLGEEPPKAMNCGSCVYFIQHYIKAGLSNYIETYAGHCVHGRVVDKKPGGKTCRYFEPGCRKKF